MIRNDRQLKIALKKYRALLRSRKAATDSVEQQTYDALTSEILEQVSAYQQVRSGLVSVFPVSSIDDLGPVIIKARIARGWTQKRLAEELGVTEQAVQKDEARGYEHAGVAKVAEVLDTLSYELVGAVRPSEAGQTATYWHDLFTLGAFASGSSDVQSLVGEFRSVEPFYQPGDVFFANSVTISTAVTAAPPPMLVTTENSEAA